MRERITITIKEDLLKQIDRLVDNLTIRSRSQAVEYLLTKVLSDFKLKNALILAGGKKNEILLLKKPKFLIEFGNKNLLEHVMDSIHEFNISNFIIYVDSFSDEIIGNLSAKNLPYRIEFVRGEKPTGTVEPLLKAKNILKDTFLVSYGDVLTSVNLNEMLAFHKKNKALATIALTTVSNPREYGVVNLEGNKVKRFVQKPKKEVPSYLIHAGYFLFEPEIFKYVSRHMQSLEKDLFPKLAEKGILYGYPFQGMFINIHSKGDIERAKILF